MRRLNGAWGITAVASLIVGGAIEAPSLHATARQPTTLESMLLRIAEGVNERFRGTSEKIEAIGGAAEKLADWATEVEIDQAHAEQRNGLLWISLPLKES